jgi:hypothetical protein
MTQTYLAGDDVLTNTTRSHAHTHKNTPHHRCLSLSISKMKDTLPYFPSSLALEWCFDFLISQSIVLDGFNSESEYEMVCGWNGMQWN